MSSTPNTPEELLSALLDEQLSGTEKERAEQLAREPQYQPLWHSLMEQRKMLRDLPKYRLPDGFADQTLALAVKQSKGLVSGSKADSGANGSKLKAAVESPTFSLGAEMRIAFGAVATLAALLLVLLVVVPPAKSGSVADNQIGNSPETSELGSSTGTAGQDSKSGEAASPEGQSNASSMASEAKISNQPASSSKATQPEARLIQGARMASAGDAKKNKVADEIWMLDLKDEAELEALQKALRERGIEWQGEVPTSIQQSAGEAYDAIFVKTSALNLNQVVTELIEKELVASVLKIPTVPDLSLFATGERDLALRVKELEYVSPQKNSPSEAEHRQQIEAINDWFDLDKSVVDDVSELRKRTYLLMLRRVQ